MWNDGRFTAEAVPTASLVKQHWSELFKSDRSLNSTDFASFLCAFDFMAEETQTGDGWENNVKLAQALKGKTGES